eukprot:COSAG02_NODE_4592_length_5182_cov_4.487901_1_plen_39_part_00
MTQFSHPLDSEVMVIQSFSLRSCRGTASVSKSEGDGDA